MTKSTANLDVTPSWVFFTVVFFILSITVTSSGIFYFPVDNWVKGYMAMGLISCIASSIIFTKTQRDLYEAKKINSEFYSVN